ncbi:MAG TPA: class I SAM-dependent methyltransferase [Candidatus Saccharimonadales bacterium]|nr:class I SAM-dependent methyltransferase [Candidatus Saccharimonadales bacterium]
MSKYANIWDEKDDLVTDSEADKNSPWFKMMRWMPKGQRVLDVGCSSGYFGEKLIAARGDEVWGLEIDPKDAANARKRGYKQVFEGDLDSFDWQQLSGLQFDAILFVDVLEHIKDPLGCLKAVSKYLAKGGSFYCSIPNVANMTVRTELMEGSFDYESTGLLDNTHIRFFTKKTVFTTFAAAGLEIVNIDATVGDHSDGHIKAHLQKLGLEPTAKFDKLLASPEARTFQFVVEAKKASGTPSVPPEYSIPSKLHDDWPTIAQKMDDDDARIKELERENRGLHERLEAAEERWATVRRHPVRWIAKAAARRVKGRGTPGA